MIERFTVHRDPMPIGKYHQWQKPDDLAERFIRHSTKRGDLVFDPFAGTGTFLLAASKLGRRGVGCEIDKKMIEIARKRGCEIRLKA